MEVHEASLVFKWIKFYWDDFKEYFEFDDDVEFHVRPVRGNTHGWYRSKKKKIEEKRAVASVVMMRRKRRGALLEEEQQRQQQQHERKRLRR